MMDVARAFDARIPLRAVFIGPEVKTALLLNLAQKLPKPVWIVSSGGRRKTITEGQVDAHIQLVNLDNIEATISLRHGVVLVTNGDSSGDLAGLSFQNLQRLITFASSHSISILIDAGQTHPQEINALLSDLAIKEVVVAGRSDRIDLPFFLSSITAPKDALKMAWLTHVKTAQQAGIASRLAVDLLKDYHRIILTGRTGMKACYQKVAGIILAGGGSSRFGYPKQLALWRGIPLVRHAALRALETGLSPVVVVLGAVDEAIRAVLDDLPLEYAVNFRWQDGQSTSIQAGLASLDERCGTCIFLLADQPQVTTSLLLALIEEHRSTLAPIIAPLIQGRRGNPVLFDQKTFADLRSIRGDQGGRAIFPRYPIHWLEWLDERLLVDIDTPEDLARLGDKE